MHGKIQARSRFETNDLRRILYFCAVDTGVVIAVQERIQPRLAAPEFQLTVTPDELIEHHQVWCLACRLACFCPQVRVSVLIQSECLEAS